MDDLYGLPLEQFVPARDAHAKELRAAGDRAGAEEVKKLPKPTRAAWAVNAAVRADTDAASALAESARLLEDAQRELLAGGDAAALRHATGRARAAVDALVAAAPDGSETTRAKVRETLFAALVDPDVLAEVAAGRVVRERIASGFGGLAGPLPTRRAQKPAPRDAEPSKKAARDAARRQEKLRRAKEAEAAADQAVTAVAEALEQVQAALESRRAELRAAEARLADARRRRERAEGT